ncbi:hypothetical protein L3Q82_021153 [Scortum barcoo]|uniref:Uncharacterized protein n=1 Tax=Scortum barcoo TaxID=214431 RepID=A0ACB8X3F7_9TELE|nr:hypothetical protein L3Q82_021153 [Scortum barcoo]
MILRDFLNRFVFVYLDDILIYSRNLPDHQLHVRQVLQRLLENRLFVKKEKCEFHASQVDFLGFIIKEGCVQADPAKVRAVAEWPIPTNRKLLQRFLGFANFYRRFIRNYSQEAGAAPLTALTSPSCPFVWSEEAEKAFNRLRTLFTTAPVLVQPDPAQQFWWPITTSGKSGVAGGQDGAGGVAPLVGGVKHSPSLSGPTTRTWPIYRQAKRLNSRQARWSLFFSRFDFVLTYRPGSRNIKPDALSRQFSVEEKVQEENILPTSRVIAAITWDIEEQPSCGLNSSSQTPGRDLRAACLSLLTLSGHKFCNGLTRPSSHVTQASTTPTLLPSPSSPQPVRQPTFSPTTSYAFMAFHGTLCRIGVRSSSHRFGSHSVTGLGASVSLTSGFHPQSNGQDGEDEPGPRVSATLCHDAGNQSTWCTYLPWVELAHNSLVSSATGVSPFEASLGYQPPLFPRQEQELAVPSIQHHLQRCKAVWQRTQAALEATVQRNRRSADKHRLPAPQYSQGQSIWLSSRNIPLRCESRKLSPRYLGPFIIQEIINPLRRPPQAALVYEDPSHLSCVPDKAGCHKRPESSS